MSLKEWLWLLCGKQAIGEVMRGQKDARREATGLAWIRLITDEVVRIIGFLGISWGQMKSNIW